MEKDLARKLAAEVAKHEQEYVATNHDGPTPDPNEGGGENEE